MVERRLEQAAEEVLYAATQTPPFGMSVYAIRSALDDPDVSVAGILASAAPFTLLMFLCLAAVIAVTEIATGLRQYRART